MSTLSQFLPQGDSFVGEVISGPSSVWGGNPSFSGKEYLRTGLIKSYDPSYAGLAAALPTACVANASATNYLASDRSWDTYVYGPLANAYSIIMYAPASIYYIGGNYHLHYRMYGGSLAGAAGFAIKYGTSLSAAPTNVFQYSANAGSADSTLFNNRLLVTFSGNIHASTGTSYTNVYTPGNVSAAYFAKSPSLCVSINNIDSNSAPRIVTSSDGVTWTERTSNINMGTMGRFFYSTPAAAFFYINTSGSIWSSTDGYTWTARTAPSGMPASVQGNTVGTIVDTATATYVSLGAPSTSSTYLLKITGLTSYSLIDLATTGTGNLVGLFSGTAGMLPYLNYNGTYLYMTYGRVRAYSTDGVTWTLGTQLNQTFDANLTSLYPVIDGSGSNIYYVWYFQPNNFSGGTVSIGNYTSKSFGATPDFVGSSTTLALASGSSLSTYFRIK